MAKKQKSLTRVGKVYGKNGRIPVGRTKFYEDYVATGRLTLIPLGLRANSNKSLGRKQPQDLARDAPFGRELRRWRLSLPAPSGGRCARLDCGGLTAVAGFD